MRCVKMEEPLKNMYINIYICTSLCGKEIAILKIRKNKSGWASDNKHERKGKE